MRIKINLVLLLSLAFCFSAPAQDQKSVVKIEFSSLTRGYSESVVISKDSVTTEKTGVGMENEKKRCRKLKPGEWKSLQATLKNISLKEIPALKSPTKDRAFDGARHSSIAITTNTGALFMHGFDNENPHEKLRPLMLAIRKVTE